MLKDALLFTLGLVVLTGGAEALIRGASRLAYSLGLSAVMVGMTIVAYGTSAPELVVGVVASVEKESAIVYGNVVGSNIANLALILGVALLIHPFRIDAASFRPVRKRIPFLKLPFLLGGRVPFLVFVTALMLVFCLDGEIGRLDGAVFLLVLAWFFYKEILLGIRQRRGNGGAGAKGPEGGPADRTKAPGRITWYVTMIVLGLAGLVVGAELIVLSAVSLGHTLGVSERIIGITAVAIGTSLPELAAAFVASFRRESELLLGGVVGSNVFNVLIILGISSLIFPIAVDTSVLSLDFAFVLGLPLLLLALVSWDHRFRRAYGFLLIAAYGGYMYLLLR